MLHDVEWVDGHRGRARAIGGGRLSDPARRLRHVARGKRAAERLECPSGRSLSPGIGASVPGTAQYVGGKWPAATLDVYAHPWSRDDGRARDAVDAILVRDQCGTGDRTGPMSVRE